MSALIGFVIGFSCGVVLTIVAVMLVRYRESRLP